ncbi:DUF2470 domain-containing protein [Saccharomonospora saliphila]|uniref:DUF2470 domain-containing protein n=1 Tax=Saccharomonospora saliphila TaxID=369829 RepID=UPI000377497F|nr:DUF2470 domain-containing protein [Saccharomonospora saliphila]
MSDSLPRRPPTPRPAERAKTMAVRGGPATLVPALGERGEPGIDGAHTGERITPALWHLHAGDDVSVLLPDEDPLVCSVRDAGTGELAMTLEVTDLAPLPMRQPVRGLLWLTGWLRALDEASARARALRLSETNPDPRVLDLGHGMTMLRLTPVSVVLADTEGTHSLSPVTFDAAQPDPFCRHEQRWLEHLEHDHTDVVSALARHVPEELTDGRVLPLGLDRCGMRLRVETDSDDHDIRLAFSRSIEEPPHLSIELRKLVGCPFTRQREQDRQDRP